ncbi:MAG: helix-turn-helix domain-containing protein [Planctomycetaceae bacterium]|jgi:DNA-binding XRE family transcriptional regulator|nr:helix-turn-helix domain-containing protein [Planctomycetaceae bacterium]
MTLQNLHHEILTNTDCRNVTVHFEPSVDGYDVLHKNFVDKDPEMESRLLVVKEKRIVGQQIFDLRESANLSQDELGNKVGLTADEIDSLEMADYEEHPFTILRKIADVFGKKIEIRFV